MSGKKRFILQLVVFAVVALVCLGYVFLHRGDLASRPTYLIESTSETFEQYLELLNARALSRAELRQWVKGGTLKEAQQAIADMEGESGADEGDDAGLLAALRGAGED